MRLAWFPVHSVSAVICPFVQFLFFSALVSRSLVSMLLVANSVNLFWNKKDTSGFHVHLGGVFLSCSWIMMNIIITLVVCMSFWCLSRSPPEAGATRSMPAATTPSILSKTISIDPPWRQTKRPCRIALDHQVRAWP